MPSACFVFGMNVSITRIELRCVTESLSPPISGSVLTVFCHPSRCFVASVACLASYPATA